MQLVYVVPNVQLLECVSCDLSVVDATEELDLAPLAYPDDGLKRVSA
jgi:hypothetical protein